jgi:hypothetical protein
MAWGTRCAGPCDMGLSQGDVKHFWDFEYVPIGFLSRGVFWSLFVMDLPERLRVRLGQATLPGAPLPLPSQRVDLGGAGHGRQWGQDRVQGSVAPDWFSWSKF